MEKLLGEYVEKCYELVVIFIIDRAMKVGIQLYVPC